MTPFASVAMLEKLALLKIARCRAPAFSSAAFAFLRKVRSPAPSEDAGPGLVACFPLATVLAPVTDAHFRTSDAIREGRGRRGTAEERRGGPAAGAAVQHSLCRDH